MPEILKSFSYLAFHLVVWGSLFLGKILYPKMRFPSLRKLIRVGEVSLVFIIWDALVTNRWWYFTDQFILGKIGPLPLEEIFFFISIPYALLVITENIRAFWSEKDKIILPKSFNYFFHLCQLLILALMVNSILKGWQYTFVVSFLCLILFRKHHFSNPVFTLGFALSMATTFIFNLYLTILPIVTYNQLYKSNWLLLSIPIEDFFYGAIFYQYIFRRYYGRSVIHQKIQKTN